MHCRSPVTDDFVLDNTKVSWRTKNYKPYRENLLLDMEKARLPDTQQYAAAVINARTLLNDSNKEIARITSLLSEVRQILRMSVDEYSTFKEITISESRKQQQQALKDKRKYLDELKPVKASNQAARNVIWNHGLHQANSQPSAQLRRPMVKACIADGCRGFLSEDFECPLCSMKVCKKCHEGLSEAHECNEDVVANVKALAAEARPCPSCAASISKIDGCDQMWCTQCQTTFSWRTGLKEEGHTHNPHYYEFMRRNGGVVPRAPGDIRVACGMPDLQQLASKLYTIPGLREEYNILERGWSNYNRRAYYQKQRERLNIQDHNLQHYHPIAEPWPCPVDIKAPFENDLAYVVALTTYHRNIIHINRTVIRALTTDPPNNHDLRVKFMLGDINEETLRISLQRRDKAYRKDIAKRHVYEMVYQASSDILRNFINSTDSVQTQLHPTYLQLVELFLYANSCFTRLEKGYTCTISTYNLNPFQVSRVMW
jgi:hypothetical protein